MIPVAGVPAEVCGLDRSAAWISRICEETLGVAFPAAVGLVGADWGEVGCGPWFARLGGVGPCVPVAAAWGLVAAFMERATDSVLA